MDVRISAALLPALYGKPGVILDVPPPQADATGSGPALWWLDGHGVLRAAGEEQAPAGPLPGLPAACLGLVAFTRAGAERLEALARNWRALCPETAPSLIDLSAGGAAPETVLPVLAGLAGPLLKAGRHAAGLSRQLVALRRDHESLRETRAALAEALARPAAALHAVPPSADTIGPPPPEGWLRQVLPVSARGLAALDLHARMDGPPGEGRFDLEIWRLEEGRLLAAFALPLDAFAGGWRRFALGEAAACPGGSAEMRLTWRGDGAPALRLSLAAATVAVTDPLLAADGCSSGRVLALRLFATAPGRPALMGEDPR